MCVYVCAKWDVCVCVCMGCMQTRRRKLQAVEGGGESEGNSLEGPSGEPSRASSLRHIQVGGDSSEETHLDLSSVPADMRDEVLQVESFSPVCGFVCVMYGCVFV